jgi:glycerate kinase
MASASGLALLESGERDPLRATTFGTGQLMQDAIAQGARRLVIGLGGSATNDGGMGIARAFGYRFWDDSDASIETPDRLPSLERIERPERLPEIEVLVLADVTNPLLGPRGATAIYGPQKGVTADTAGLLESALECLADRVARDVGEDPREAPGAGAAGGCAYGLLAFLGAQVVSGFDYICERVGLESAVERGDVVITGEGRMDGQTLSGKGPAGVADRARRRGKVVAAVCGAVDDAAESALREVFGHLAVMTREVGESAAMNAPAESLRETARRLGADLLGEAARVAGKDPGP